MVDGVYKFDHTKLKEAHKWCQDQTRQALLDGYSVIVSNTFIKRWEMESYIAIARDPVINCAWHIRVCKGEYPNTHNVPYDVIDRMKASWEN
jgi:predicted kinase